MSIIGHEAQKTFLEKVQASGRLSHAYLFVGPPSVGKSAVAEWFCHQLLEMSDENIYHHPDLLIVRQETDEKTGKMKKHIDIGQIRLLRSFLSTRQVKGKYKIGIIEASERMNVNSANALLKTLEEPCGDTVMILTASDESLLPQTICSRAQTLYFGRVPDELIAAHLIDLGMAEERAWEMARSAGGLPGKAIVWANDGDIFDRYRHDVETFHALFGRPFFEKVKLLEPLFGDKTNHIETRGRIIDVLDIWLVEMRKMFYTTRMTDKGLMSETVFLDIISAIDDAKRQLRQNVHPRLLVEHILLRLP